MPSFIDFSTALPKAALLGVEPFSLDEDPDLSLTLRSENLLKDLADRDERFQFVRTRDLFCAISSKKECAWHIENELLLVDQDHLSPMAMKLFGNKIAEELNLQGGPNDIVEK